MHFSGTPVLIRSFYFGRPLYSVGSGDLEILVLLVKSLKVVLEFRNYKRLHSSNNSVFCSR